MANPAVTISVGANTSSALQSIQSITGKQYSINLQVNSQPLGRITGQLSEFNKSLDAANARVVAFGASAGAIMGIRKAFDMLISSTIEVEKSLKNIQVVTNASASEMQKFGQQLFDIAKNTGQSFGTVAEAATELSRQGLGVAETLKRTNEALILSRLSGMTAAQSVDTLTASVNSFSNQAVTATQIVNKLANVDAAFAVSSKDLAEGISRVGASASQSGVSIDELIALITSAQQVTARGGAVIGNSFKTIFTRLERGKTQDLLESLGVSTKDTEGKLKSTIQLLKDLANVYGTLDQNKQAEVAEKVGGVFQINILKAALGDLGKEYSIYNGALNTSRDATDEAIKRNEQLNETYDAQINKLKENAAQLAASAGKRVFGPSMDTVLGAGNSLLGSINESDGSGIGAKIGKGVLDGIGQVIAGPGLVMIGAVIIKLLGDFTKFAGGSAKELLGLNAASKEQAAIQASITKMLEKDPGLIAQINSQAKTQADQAQILLGIYQQQTAQMQQQAALTSQLAKQLYTGGVRMGPSGVPVTTKASGYIPNFSKEDAERLAAKNHKGGYNAGRVFDRTLYDGNGRSFIATVNSAEKITDFKNSAGYKATIVEPPNGFAASGYIPNFVPNNKRKEEIERNNLLDKLKNATPEDVQIAWRRKTELNSSSSDIYKALMGLSPAERAATLSETERRANSTIVLSELEKTRKTQEQNLKNKAQNAQRLNSSSIASVLLPMSGPINKSGESLNTSGKILVEDIPLLGLRTDGSKKLVDDAIGEGFVNEIRDATFPLVSKKLNDILKSISPSIDFNKVDSNVLQSQFSPEATGGARGAFGAMQAFAGSIFEVGINAGLGYAADKGSQKTGGDFDVRGGANLDKIKKLFGMTTQLGDYKISASTGNLESFANKVVKEYGGGDESLAIEKLNTLKAGDKKNIKSKIAKNAASGYIPNFADAMRESVSREMAAGVPENEIYVKKYNQLAGPDNPDGLGVFNRRDEGTVSKEKRAMRNRGYATGYIPNFADTDGNDSIDSTISAVAIELSSLVGVLAINRNAIAEAYEEEIRIRKISSDKALESQQENITQQENALATAQNLTEQQKSNQKANIEAEKQKFEANLKATKASFKDRAIVGLKSAAPQLGTIGTVLGPAIAATIANSIDKNTKEGRASAAATTGAGNVVSGTIAGAMAAGPMGAAIGATLSGFAALDSYLREVNTSLPEYVNALNKATETQARFQDTQTKINTLTEKLKETREQQGGAADTKEQRNLINQLNEAAGGLSIETRGKLMGSNYDFDAVRQIMVQQAEINVKDLAQKQREKELVQSAEKGRDQGIFASIGRSTMGSKDAELNKVSFDTNQSKGMIERYVGYILTLGISEIGSIQSERDYIKGEEGATNAAQDLSKTIFQSAGNDPKKIQDMSKMFAQESVSFSGNMGIRKLGEMAGYSAQAMEDLYKAGVPTTSILSNLAQIGFQLADKQKKQAIEMASFNQKFGPVIGTLEKFKIKLGDFLASANITSKNVLADQKFGFDFQQSRNVSMATSIEQMGLSEMARDMSIKNDYNAVVGKARSDSQNEIAESIRSALLGENVAEDLIPKGKPTSGVSMEAGEKELRSQIDKIANITGGRGKENIISDVKGTLSKFASADTTERGTAFGGTQQFDKNAILDALKQSQTFKNLSPEKQADGLKNLSAAVDKGNENLLSTQRELATKAAQQIDQLIQIQLQQLQKFGGGAQSILSDKGPEAGKAIDKAVMGYVQTTSNPFATNLQKGREALKVGESINTLMGGAATIGQDSPIFKDVQAGLKDGLKQIWGTTRSSLSRMEGGEEQIKKMEASTLKLTGAEDMDTAFERVAEYQAMKNLGLDTRNTTMGENLYQQQRQTAIDRLNSQGEQGQAMAAAYEKASVITTDPAAVATYTLKDSMETLIGNTNTLLSQALDMKTGQSTPLSMPVNPFTSAGAKFVETAQNAGLSGPAAGVGPQKEGITASQFTHDFNINIGLPESASPGGPAMDGLSSELQSAVEKAVAPILSDFYTDISKLEYKVDNGGKTPPPSTSTSQTSP